MYNLRGFIAINPFVSNVVGTISTIGELSSHSATFSREVGRYGRAAYPNVRLISFHSKLNDVSVAIDPDYEDTVLSMMEWMFQKSIDGTFTNNRDNALQAVFNEFDTIVDIVDMGIMVTNGTYWLPESLTFSVRGPDDNLCKVWFSDTAFKAQYDLFEIVVVPPVVPLDDLHRDRTSVLNLLQSITPSSHVKDIEDLRAGIPDTLTISTPYDWVDKNDETITQPTPWTVITYGNAANNSDIIKETIVDYILDNSVYPREEWEKIYPDLFLPTEYFLSPAWHKYSLPNQQNIGGLYSPIVRITEAQYLAELTFYDYDLPHILEYYSVVPTLYKGGLSIVCVGHPRNRNEIYDFTTLWPQYVNISTDQHDFNRISPETAEFIMLLVNMMVIAETMTPFSDVPVGFSRVERGGIYYLSVNYEKIQYLMLLKSNNIPTTP
jgi:hypothetical protein